MIHVPRLLLVIIALLAASHAVQAPTSWERYVSLPTTENARTVGEMEYSDQRNDLQRIEDDLMLLEMQVVASDPEAVDLAFRLLAKSDGHVAELLDQMLGRLTRVNPHLFLLAAQRHPEAINGGLVGNFGPAFVDRELAHAYERDQRVRSLLKVTDVSLKQVRDACIRLLQSD